MDRPTVSVILLNFNGWEHTKICLNSLSELEYPSSKLEVFVVDNASTDGSAEKIEAGFPGVRLIRCETNLGFSRGANLAASKASGEYLAFLNNDMRVGRDWLNPLIESAAVDERLACVGSSILNWDGTQIDFVGRPDDAFCLAPDSNTQEQPNHSAADGDRTALFVSAGAALFRAGAFREIGGFDPDYFLYHEDVDLCWRLWLRGYKCALSPKSVVYHRGGASSKKLPVEYIQGLAQQHILFTLFKNLEASTLGKLFALVLYVLLERRRWDAARPVSIEEAVAEFHRCIGRLIGKRAEIQRTRAIGDDELFSIVGHPLACLLSRERYRTIGEQLSELCSPIEFSIDDPCAAAEARAQVNHWSNAAHCFVERDLVSALSAGEIQVADLYAKLARKEAEIEAKTSDVARLSVQLANEEGNERKLSEEVVRTRNSLAIQLAETEERLQSLSNEMAVITTSLARELSEREKRIEALSDELARIKRSFGWRLLNVYGRVKYRYLLPVYKILGLGGSKRRQAAGEKTASSR